MKLLNRYEWFALITLAFLIDSLLGYVFLFFTGGWAINGEEYDLQTMVLVTCKTVSNSLWFFYILRKPPVIKMDLYDVLLCILCGVISIYCAVSIFAGSINVSMWVFWGVYIFFYLIIFILKVKSIKKIRHA